VIAALELLQIRVRQAFEDGLTLLFTFLFDGLCVDDLFLLSLHPFNVHNFLML
jgi:hypothetical protein